MRASVSFIFIHNCIRCVEKIRICMEKGKNQALNS